MKIEAGKVVTLTYDITDEQGEIIESSDLSGPVSFLVGKGAIIKGLDSRIIGMTEGDEADLLICGAETGLTFTDLGEVCPGTPGWWTLDIGAHRRINHWLILDIATNNLFDAQYRVHGSGLDAPGRDVRLRLTAQRIRPR